MKIFKCREEKTVLSILISAFLSCLVIGTVYSGSLSSEDRAIRDNDSSIFSPGYINAAKQHTESIIKQTEEKKGFWQRAIESLQDKLAANTAKDADNIVVPELKKKKSGSGENTAKTAEVAQDMPSLPEMLDSKTMMSNILNNVISKEGSVTMLDNGSMVTMWHEGDKPYFSVMDGFGETVIEKQFIDPVKGMQYSNISNIHAMGHGKFLIEMFGANINYNFSDDGDSFTYENMGDLRIYDSTTGKIEDSETYLSTEYLHTDYNTGKSIFDASVNRVSNLAYLGDGSLAMTIMSGSYHYRDRYRSPGSGSASISSSLRILDNNFHTFKDHTFSTLNANGPSFAKEISVQGIASLGNGRFVLATKEIDYTHGYNALNNYGNKTNFTVMDKDFNKYGGLIIENSYTYNSKLTTWAGQCLTDITSLGNGRFAAGWIAGTVTYDKAAWRTDNSNINVIVDTFTLGADGENSYYLNKDTSNLLEKSCISSDDGNIRTHTSNYIADMKALDNGSLVMIVRSNRVFYNYATREHYGFTNNASIRLIDNKGDIKDIAIGSAGSNITDLDALHLTTLGDTFGVVVLESGYDSNGEDVGGVTAKIFSSENSYSRPYVPDNTYDSSSSKEANVSEYKDKAGNLRLKEADSREMVLEAYNPRLKDTADSVSGLKTSLNMNPLAAKEALGHGINPNTMASEHLLMKLNTYIIMNMDALSSYSIFSDTGTGTYARLMASSALLNMLKNPAEDDKNTIDTILAIFNDISKKDAEGNTILNRGEVDDLIKAIAATMLAQAIPDLLSGNDLANMKSAFLELSMERSQILKNYDASTKLYYDEMVKEIASNLQILQVNGMVSKEMAKKDVVRMPRNEIDLIIEKIKKEQKKSAETEHIIQQEAKYRKLCIDPNKKLMEDRMKAMIKNYVNKVNSAMESASKDVASRKK